MSMDVNAKLTLDTAGFDAPLKKSGELSNATSRAMEKAAKAAAQAQAVAAKYAGDEVSKQSLRIVVAKRLEAAAAGEMRKAHKAAESGYLSEAESAKVEASALQKLTAAKLKTAEASEVARKAHERESLTFREHIQGLSVGGAMGESMAGIAEVLAAAEGVNKLREVVSASLEFGEAMKRASEETGLEVGTLSTLHYAAAITGGDFNRMTEAVARMNKMIGMATEGNKTAIAFIAALGLHAKQLADSPQGAEIAFRRFAQVLSATENPIRRNELAMTLLGRAGADEIPTIIEIGNHWDEFRSKAAAAGVQLDGRTAASLEATQERLKDIQQYIFGARLAFTQGFLPGFDQMLTVIAGGKSLMDEVEAWGRRMAKVLAFLGEAGYVAASGMEAAFGVQEAMTPGQGDMARRDLAQSKEMWHKADQMHDIAFGGPLAPAAMPKLGTGLGDYVADFLDRNNLGGRHTHNFGNADHGFGGVGDLTGGENKAAQERLKAMEAELTQRKLDTQLSAKSEYDYWQAKIGAFQKGSEQYNAIVAKQAQLAEQGARKAHELIQRQVAAARRESSGADVATVTASMDRVAAQRQRDAQRAGDSQTQDYVESNQLAMLQARNEAREKEAQLTDAAGRSMTKYAAAVALATVHAEEFEQQMRALEAIRDTRAMAAGLNPSKENNRALAVSQAAIASAVAERQIEQQRDREAIYGRETSAVVGATDALDEFVQAARDSAGAMHALTADTLHGLNGEIVRGISGQRTNFTGFGADLFRKVASIGLDKAEGSILGIFGLGGGKPKPTGAPGDPLYVIQTNAANTASSLGRLASSLGGVLGLGGGASAALGGTGFLSELGGFALQALPMLAGGGAISAGTMAIVGEDGPELFMPGASGTIVPNHQLGGSSTTHHWNIDARGATDPAQVEAAVQRGIARAAPQIAAMGARASRDIQMRRPSMMR